MSLGGLPIHIEIASKEACTNCNVALKFVEDWGEVHGLQDSIVVNAHKAPPADTDPIAYRAYVDSLKARIAPIEHKAFPFVWLNGHFVGGHVQLQRALIRLAREREQA